MDAGGWLFLALGWAVVLAGRTIRADRRLLTAVSIVLTVHMAAVISHAYWKDLPGSSLDAQTFHKNAVYLSSTDRPVEFSAGSRFYRNALAIAYGFFGPSKLLGSALSFFAFALAVVLLVQLFVLLGRTASPALVLLFGLFPSVVVFTSITLRESFELVLIMSLVYWGLRMKVRPVPVAFSLMVASGALLGLFHVILLPFALVAVLAFVLLRWSGRPPPRSRLRSAPLVASAAILGVIGLLALQVTVDDRDNMFLRLKDGVFPAIVKYRERVETSKPRTSFGATFDDSSVAAIVRSLVVNYGLYLSAPLPWQVDDATDLVAAAESAVRMLLLLAAGIVLWRTGNPAYLVLMVIYLALSFGWSVGTTNYGQAIRHHVLSNWLLVVVGGPLLASWLRLKTAR